MALNSVLPAIPNQMRHIFPQGLELHTAHWKLHAFFLGASPHARGHPTVEPPPSRCVGGPHPCFNVTVVDAGCAKQKPISDKDGADCACMGSWCGYNGPIESPRRLRHPQGI